MSLYHEAASFITPSASTLKTRVFADKSLKNKPVHIYALVTEATKWSGILAPFIEAVGLLDLERSLTPELALLLCHDLLVSRNGVAAPKGHVLRKAVERHKARLGAEFTRRRVGAGCATLGEWRMKAEEGIAEEGGRGMGRHLRWVRVNTLKTTLDRQVEEFQSQGWRRVADVASLRDGTTLDDGASKVFAVDTNVPNLLAIPPGTDLTNTEAYKTGRVVLQDKASCFPALLMNLSTLPGGDIIDACAAPGNKTTHLAALVNSAQPDRHAAARGRRSIFAVERDGNRAQTLEKMVSTAGAADHVKLLPQQDFLKLKPEDSRFANVTGILLDPSCSGSGIVGRDEVEEDRGPKFVLPRRGVASAKTVQDNKSRGKKRKRGKQGSEKKTAISNDGGAVPATDPQSRDSPPDDTHANGEIVDQALQDRLQRLSHLQTKMLKHAMSFPRCMRIVYSTCSVHYQENEQVVLRALQSRVGAEYGLWRPLSRGDQSAGLATWSRRGDLDAILETVKGGKMEVTPIEAVRLDEASIRCEKGGKEGTMGFFACGLARDLVDRGRGVDRGVENEGASGHQSERRGDIDDSEWEGFSD